VDSSKSSSSSSSSAQLLTLGCAPPKMAASMAAVSSSSRCRAAFLDAFLPTGSPSPSLPGFSDGFFLLVLVLRAEKRLLVAKLISWPDRPAAVTIRPSAEELLQRCCASCYRKVLQQSAGARGDSCDAEDDKCERLLRPRARTKAVLREIG